MLLYVDKHLKNESHFSLLFQTSGILTRKVPVMTVTEDRFCDLFY